MSKFEKVREGFGKRVFFEVLDQNGLIDRKNNYKIVIVFLYLFLEKDLETFSLYSV